jgi:hypothetical protein
MRNLVGDAGHMELRGAGARPLKTARDRVSEVRTGAHRADDELDGSDRKALSIEAQGPRSPAAGDICPAPAYVGAATSTAAPPRRADPVTAARRAALPERASLKRPEAASSARGRSDRR